MFFQSIHQMLAAGTDLSINIRRMDDHLSVVVMPRRTNLKDEAGQLIVPLVLNGTPIELDGQFLQAVTTPLQKAQGILINLESFEKQAGQAAAQSKAAKAVEDKESKEAREKREKMEKLLKKAEEATIGNRHSEAMMWLKQAKVLATPEKQKEIEAKIQEVQNKASEGSLFADAAPQVSPMPQQADAPQQPSVSKQPPASSIPGQHEDGQMQMFQTQPVQQPMPQPIFQPSPQPVPQYASQPAFQPTPQPQTAAQFQTQPQAYQPGMQQQPMYGQSYYQHPVNEMAGQPMELQPVGQPQMYIRQPEGQAQQVQQWQQSQFIPQQPQTITMQAASGNTGREYHSQPQPTETLSFDKDDESDRALLREDPYAEYLDFPKEYRMKDEAQMELVCC